jgi:hypothetical protein
MANNDPEIGGNGWGEYKRLVVSELDRLDGDIKVLTEKIDAMRADLIALRVKVGLIGAASGLIVGGVISLLVKVVVH